MLWNFYCSCKIKCMVFIPSTIDVLSALNILNLFLKFKPNIKIYFKLDLS